MKKIFTLFASLLLTIALFAADRPKSMLTIKSSDQSSDIRVIIDGRRFEPNDNYMRIRDMRPGYHSIKIYRERNFGIFTILGQRYDVVFNNSLFVKPQSNIMINIDRFGRAQVFENRMGRRFDSDDRNWTHDHDFDFDGGRNYGDYGDHDRNSNDRDSRWGDRDGDNDDYGNNGYGNNGGYGNYGNGTNGGYGNYGNGSNFGRTLSDAEFDGVLNNISREGSENNMLRSATQIINTNYLTSEQVKEMLQLFNFENNKLDLAKLAYDRTVDKRNYFVVNDVFSYGSSKEELARFIRNH
ncbi:MAG TPA: DUF4476 domain-containing protein [Chitinophagaceae bacterium]|nr:DUF4476 domain-containing protein [Chitinophagaceae bacterium]